MKLYKALLQKRAELIAAQQANLDAVTAAGGAFTDEQRAADDKFAAELKAVNEDIARVQAARNAALEAQALPIESLPADFRDNEAEAGFKSFGEQLIAVKNLAATGRTDKRLLAVNERVQASLGMREEVLSDGGALVQTEFSNTLMEKTYSIGQVLNQVPNQPLGANSNAYSALFVDETSRADGSRYGGVQFYRLAEGVTINPSRPKLRRKEIKADKLAAVCYATDELVTDAVQLEGHIGRIFPQEARYVMENELFNGTGAGQSTGVINATARISVPAESGQAAATIEYPNLVKMWARCWAPSRPSAAWYYDQSCEPQLFQMAMPVGTAALEPRFINFGPDGSLRAFGRPMIPVEYAQQVGTEGDLVLADFSQYLAVTKGGLRTETSIHVAFLTDELAFRFIIRWKAEPMWKEALTPRNSGPTLSPFVTLATRS